MPKKLYIEGGKNHPEVNFDPEKRIFSIKGKSFPENPGRFYQPLIDYIADLNLKPGDEITMEMLFYYLSSSSVISILEIIKELEDLRQKGYKINIKWMYDEDDDDMRKIGEDYINITSLPFEMIPVDDDEEED